MIYVTIHISFEYIVVCDFLELLMCAMSVQDILVEKSNGESELNPMYHLWKLGLSLIKDADPIVRILFVL